MKTITLTEVNPKKRSFYESVVLSMITKMQQGHLLLTLPDGEEMEFGNSVETIKAKIWIRNPAFFKSVILYGDIGFGESYVDGYWETDNITNVIQWFLLNLDNVPVISGTNAKTWVLNTLKLSNKLYHIGRANSLDGSKKNISAHYDLNNHF